MTTCPKCEGSGRLYSDGPVIYRFVCDRCRGDGESGEWTATPPDKPGWYWWQNERGDLRKPLEVWVYEDELITNHGRLERLRGLWWSEPIQEPPA